MKLRKNRIMCEGKQLATVIRDNLSNNMLIVIDKALRQNLTASALIKMRALVEENSKVPAKCIWF